MSIVREPKRPNDERRPNANITLSLPKELKEELAELARRRGLSVNALMLGVIEGLVRGEKKPTGADFVALARALPLAPRNEALKWNREDAYEDL